MVPHIPIRNVWLVLLWPMQVLGQSTNNGLPSSDIDEYFKDRADSNGNYSDFSNIAGNFMPFVASNSAQGTIHNIGDYSKSSQVMSRSTIDLGSTEMTSTSLFSSMTTPTRISEGPIASFNDRFSLTNELSYENLNLQRSDSSSRSLLSTVWENSGISSHPAGVTSIPTSRSESSSGSTKVSASAPRNLVNGHAWGGSENSMSIEISLPESIKDSSSGIISSAIKMSPSRSESGSVRSAMDPSTQSTIVSVSSSSAMPTTYLQSPIAGKMNMLQSHIHRSNSESAFFTISSISVTKTGNLVSITPSITGAGSSSAPNTMTISGTTTTKSSVVSIGTLSASGSFSSSNARSISGALSHTAYSYTRSYLNILNKVGPSAPSQVSKNSFSTTSGEYSSYTRGSTGKFIHTSFTELPSQAKNSLIPNSNPFLDSTELSRLSSTSRFSNEPNSQSPLASSTPDFTQSLTSVFISVSPSRRTTNIPTSKGLEADTFSQKGSSSGFIDSSPTILKPTSSELPMSTSGVSHIPLSDESAATATSLESPADTASTYLPKTVAISMSTSGSGISHNTWSSKSPAGTPMSSELRGGVSGSTHLPKTVTGSNQASGSLSSHPFISVPSSTDGLRVESSVSPTTRPSSSYTHTSAGYISMTSASGSGISHNTRSSKSPAGTPVSSELRGDVSSSTHLPKAVTGSNQASGSLSSHPFISVPSSTDGLRLESSASPETRSSSSYMQMSSGRFSMTSVSRSGSHNTWSSKSPAGTPVSSELRGETSGSTYLPKAVAGSSHLFSSAPSPTDGLRVESSASPETRSSSNYMQISSGRFSMTSVSGSGISHNTWSSKSPAGTPMSSELRGGVSGSTHLPKTVTGSNQASGSLSSHPFISVPSSTDGLRVESSVSPTTRPSSSYTHTSAGYISMTSASRSGSHNTWSSISPVGTPVSSELRGETSGSAYLPKAVAGSSHLFSSAPSPTDGLRVESSASPETRSSSNYMQISSGRFSMTSVSGSGISHNTWSSKSPAGTPMSSELRGGVSGSTHLPKTVTGSNQASGSLSSHSFISVPSSTDGLRVESSVSPTTRPSSSYTHTSAGYISMTSASRSGSHNTWSSISPVGTPVSSELRGETSGSAYLPKAVAGSSHLFSSAPSPTDGLRVESSASPETRSSSSYMQMSSGRFSVTSVSGSGISHNTWSSKSPAGTPVSSELRGDVSSSTHLPKAVTGSNRAPGSLSSHPFISVPSSTDGLRLESSASPETRSSSSYMQMSSGRFSMTSVSRSGSHNTWSSKSPAGTPVSSELQGDVGSSTHLPKTVTGGNQAPGSLSSHPFISVPSSTDGLRLESSASPETWSSSSYMQISSGRFSMTSASGSGISHNTWSSKSPAGTPVSSELRGDVSSSTHLPKTVTGSNRAPGSLSSHPFISVPSSTDGLRLESSASPETRSSSSYTQTSSGHISMTSITGSHDRPFSITAVGESRSSHLSLASFKSSSNIVSSAASSISITSIGGSSRISVFENSKTSKMEESSLSDASESLRSKSIMASVLNGHSTSLSESTYSQSVSKFSAQKTIPMSSPSGSSSLEENASRQTATQLSSSMMNSFSEKSGHPTKTTSSKSTHPGFQTLSSSSSTFIKESQGSISSTPFSAVSPPKSSRTSRIASTLISESAIVSPAFSETSVASSQSNTNWLPYSIIVEPSHSTPATQSFNPDVTATLPYAITPQTPVSEPSDSSVITIGFKRQLNYDFLMNTPLSSAQIFAFLPKVLVYPFNYQHIDELTDKNGFSTLNRKRTTLEPHHDVRVQNNKVDILKIINPSNVKVIQIVPMTAEDKDYLVSIAEVYFPSHRVEKLKQYVKTPKSSLYANPDPTLSALADLIDPSILLTGLLDGEGNIFEGGSQGGDSGSDSHSSTNDGSYASENRGNGSLQSPNSTLHISSVITKRLAIFLNCFAFGSLLWILCFLVTLGKIRQVLPVKEFEGNSELDTAVGVLRLRGSSSEVSTNESISTLQIFYKKSPNNASRDHSETRGTNNTNTVPASVDSNKASTDNRLSSYSDDLIVTGKNTVYSILHGLQYFVDEDGQFFYAGNGYYSKGNDSANDEGSLLDSLDNYMYAESEEISMPLIETNVSDLEVDEEGNFVLVNDEIFDNVQDANDSNSKKKTSDTVESYNNNRMYKFTETSPDNHVLFSDEAVSPMIKQHDNDTDDEYIFSGPAGNYDRRPVVDDESCPPSMTTGSIDNTSSNGLSNLPSDLDQYIYQEREGKDPIFSDWDDINIEDIDDDKVADLEIDDFDELDEEMYRRLSRLMRERSMIGKKPTRQSNVGDQNFRRTDLSSPSIIPSASVPLIRNNGRAFAGETRTTFLERNIEASNVGICHSTKPKQNRSNEAHESKKLKISAPIYSRNSLGW